MASAQEGLLEQLSVVKDLLVSTPLKLQPLRLISASLNRNIPTQSRGRTLQYRCRDVEPTKERRSICKCASNMSNDVISTETTCAVTLDYVKVEQFRSMATHFLPSPGSTRSSARWSQHHFCIGELVVSNWQSLSVEVGVSSYAPVAKCVYDAEAGRGLGRCSFVNRTLSHLRKREW